MNKYWLKMLKDDIEKEFNYDGAYDYDDMKLAIVCKDFIECAIELEHFDYEDIITLATWVRLRWNAEFEDLSFEEQGYIQAYARRILNENINEIENVLRGEV